MSDGMGKREEIDSMNRVIIATIEDGVLKPDQEIRIASGTKVRVTIEPCNDAHDRAGNACDELDTLCDEFPVDSHGDLLTRDQLHERR